MLSLTFSESVISGSVQSDSFTIHSNSTGTGSKYQLSAEAKDILRPQPHIIEVYLSDTDLNEIKADGALATTMNNTYLEMSDTAVTDSGGNKVVEILSSEPKKVSSFIGDINNPKLERFYLDLDGSGSFTLQF